MATIVIKQLIFRNAVTVKSTSQLTGMQAKFFAV